MKYIIQIKNKQFAILTEQAFLQELNIFIIVLYIDNIETHQNFVLATSIKVTPDYEYILPTNISELEDFNINLKNRLYQSSIYSDIDFYELSNNLRANELKLIKLKKKR